MKKWFFGMILTVGVVSFLSCSKDLATEITPEAEATGQSYGDPIRVTRESPLMLKSTSTADDADALWVDKLEASEIRYGDFISRNGYMEINSTVSSYLHWTNMANTVGDPGFNVFTEGTLDVTGRYEDILEDYWVAILLYLDLPTVLPQPWPLVTAVSSEGYLDCNFVYTGGGNHYLSYRSYDRNTLWDLADAFYDFRVLWLKRENNILYPNYTYPGSGQWAKDINEEYLWMIEHPSWGQPIPYQTWASNHLVFGDTSEYESSIGYYPGDNEGIRIGSIYLFPKP